MSFALILQAITAAFQFPGEIVALAKMLRSTPEEAREGIMKSVQAEADKYQQTGRPTWN